MYYATPHMCGTQHHPGYMPYAAAAPLLHHPHMSPYHNAHHHYGAPYVSSAAAHGSHGYMWPVYIPGDRPNVPHPTHPTYMPPPASPMLPFHITKHMPVEEAGDSGGAPPPPPAHDRASDQGPLRAPPTRTFRTQLSAPGHRNVPAAQMRRNSSSGMQQQQQQSVAVDSSGAVATMRLRHSVSGTQKQQQHMHGHSSSTQHRHRHSVSGMQQQHREYGDGSAYQRHRHSTSGTQLQQQQQPQQAPEDGGAAPMRLCSAAEVTHAARPAATGRRSGALSRVNASSASSSSELVQVCTYAHLLLLLGGILLALRSSLRLYVHVYVYKR